MYLFFSLFSDSIGLSDCFNQGKAPHGQLSLNMSPTISRINNVIKRPVSFTLANNSFRYRSLFSKFSF